MPAGPAPPDVLTDVLTDVLIDVLTEEADIARLAVSRYECLFDCGRLGGEDKRSLLNQEDLVRNRADDAPLPARAR